MDSLDLKLLKSLSLMKKKPKKIPRVEVPDRAANMIVNQAMLYDVRDEIKAEFRSHDRRFDSLEKRFDSVGNRLEAKIEKLSADIYRMMGLMEEQENRNRAVLDGYASIYDRQDRVEKRVDEFEKTILVLKKTAR